MRRRCADTQGKRKPDPSKEIIHVVGKRHEHQDNTTAQPVKNRRTARTHESQMGPKAGIPLVSRSYTSFEVTGPLLMMQTHSALLAL